MSGILVWTVASTILLASTEVGIFQSEFIVDPELAGRGHVHASCIIQCPNGDLLAAWYENGVPLPPPHFSEEKDKSDDVRIAGSRKRCKEERWEIPFILADTFGVSDNNPCMAIDDSGHLWLFHAVLLGVPKIAWTSALVRYYITTNYERPGAPQWEMQNLLIVHSPDLEQGNPETETRETTKSSSTRRITDPYKTRLGWMPRAHPLIRSDGALVLPLSNENFGLAAMAITQDNGGSWSIGNAVPTRGLTQPTVVEFPDRHMVAFFRNSHISKRILRSESADGGVTWSLAVPIDLPHPGSGIEAILTQSGKLLMIYNDTEKDRDSLAVSLSEDRGITWTHKRRIEHSPGQRFDYPSIVQGKEGLFHVTYSWNTKTIKYVCFNEDWIVNSE